MAQRVCAYGRYGYRRITALLQEAGWGVSVSRVARIWRREGLKVPGETTETTPAVAGRRVVHSAAAGAAEPCVGI